MKHLTPSEFEEQIRKVVDGQISIKRLAKELETDMRTLSNKIQ